MTIEQVKKEIPDMEAFCGMACNACNSDWYCPDYCIVLQKAFKMDFEKIQKSYARNDGDWSKVCRYIKRVAI